MSNPVNERLGRKRGPTAKAQRKVALEKCEKLRQEMSQTERQLRDSITVEELRS